MSSTSSPSPDGPIVRFYRLEIPDDSGRMLTEILAWDDGPLEYTHNYIQWLFPMRTASPVNPVAPTVDDATVAAFATDARLREALAGAFVRMGAFYGFGVQVQRGHVTITRSPAWSSRSANWLTPRNHNMLRNTRIITSLRLLGLERCAFAFFEELSGLNRTEAGDCIGSMTFEFWRRAAEDPL